MPSPKGRISHQHIVLIALLLPLLSLVVGVLTGAGDWQWVWGTEAGQQVLLHIRVPRVILGFLVGATLSAAGVLIQGVVRNPLAEPGLIGVSGGAAVGAALFLFFAPVALLAEYKAIGQSLAAFAGGFLALFFVVRLGMNGSSRHLVGFLILAGVSVNLLCNALIGLLVYFSPDSTLREISFWSMGSLGGADLYWNLLLFVTLLLAAFFWWSRARQLDALLLGEVEARSLGISVRRLQWQAVIWVALMVGVCVSVSGIIGFVGLISPHIARLLVGASHRRVLPVATLFGGCLVVLADTLARVIIAPGELPIGIVTTLVGAPLFVSLLLREKRHMAW